MSFFYDLNKKLDGIRATPEVTHQQLNERDEGKPGKNFAKIAKDAGERYGSKAAGERVAGAVKAKMAKAGKLEEEQVDEVVRAGVLNPTGGGGTVLNRPSTQGDRDALAKQIKNVRADTMNPAKRGGTSGKTSNAIYTAKQVDHAGDWTATPKARDGKGIASGPTMAEAGVLDTVKKVGKKVASGINKLVGHGSDEDMIKDLQRKSGAPVTGKKSTPPQQVKEKLSPAKQKSFAALAPPTDKITFADKIAGAKKEVDEMLGDVAAEAMRKALGGGKGRNAEMDEGSEENAFTAHKRPSPVQPKVGSTERGHKHDIKHTATGRIVTRRVDDQGNSVGADDDSMSSGEKRGRGRPKGTKQSIGAKGPSGKSKLMTKESDVDVTDQGEYDQEGDMAKDDIKTIVRHAQALSKVLGDNDNLPEWVQSKLAKIEGMMISIDEYMQNQAGDDDSEEPIAEKAVSKQQQKFMGMAHAMQKGEKIKGASKELKKVAKTMKPKDTEDFAKTKHKGLPDKVKSKKKDEEVDESTTSGSVATSTATTSSKGGVFGKGIYDSMNFELEQMIAESMSINMSDSTEGNKSLTVTATDEDAMRLAVMLKSAGLGGQGRELQGDHSHGEEACDTCGMQDCGCGDVHEAVDENAPDWPTNTETSSDALQYAGGLNKPKTDVAGAGQTTVPNTNVHAQEEDALRRMMEMAGIKQAELEPWEQTMKEDAEADVTDAENAVNDAEAAEEEIQEDFAESIQRMREIAGIKEAKKAVDEEKTEEGNLFTKGLEDDNVKIGDKIPGTNAIKKKDIDESIFALTNQWKAYKG